MIYSACTTDKIQGKSEDLACWSERFMVLYLPGLFKYCEICKWIKNLTINLTKVWVVDTAECPMAFLMCLKWVWYPAGQQQNKTKQADEKPKWNKTKLSKPSVVSFSFLKYILPQWPHVHGTGLLNYLKILKVLDNITEITHKALVTSLEKQNCFKV